MKSHFFAYLMRMKNIKRWGLMRNTQQENIKEHSLDVAYIAHALAAIANNVYGKNVDVKNIVMIAMYHDITEVITGDLATPVKYFNPEIKQAYKELEALSAKKIHSMIPQQIVSEYDCINGGDEYEELIVKAADKISAYFKCVEELNSGNREFSTAAKTLLDSINAFELDEVKYFMDTFADSIGLTLDELN
ncbi:MAG: 5'-deoxynucleotidase [Clostridiales bacterium]|nr:5'-deoxynucleotidase [Clostridiales bacterium]